MLVVKKTINEAGHFALVELENGSWAVQNNLKRLNRTTGKATRIGTDNDLTIFTTKVFATIRFSGMLKYILQNV